MLLVRDCFHFHSISQLVCSVDLCCHRVVLFRQGVVYEFDWMLISSIFFITSALSPVLPDPRAQLESLPLFLSLAKQHFLKQHLLVFDSLLNFCNSAVNLLMVCMKDASDCALNYEGFLLFLRVPSSFHFLHSLLWSMVDVPPCFLQLLQNLVGLSFS